MLRPSASPFRPLGGDDFCLLGIFPPICLFEIFQMTEETRGRTENFPQTVAWKSVWAKSSEFHRGHDGDLGFAAISKRARIPKSRTASMDFPEKPFASGKISDFTGYFPPKPPNQEFLERLRAFPLIIL